MIDFICLEWHVNVRSQNSRPVCYHCTTQTLPYKCSSGSLYYNLAHTFRKNTHSGTFNYILLRSTFNMLDFQDNNKHYEKITSQNNKICLLLSHAWVGSHTFNTNSLSNFTSLILDMLNILDITYFISCSFLKYMLA